MSGSLSCCRGVMTVMALVWKNVRRKLRRSRAEKILQSIVTQTSWENHEKRCEAADKSNPVTRVSDIMG